MKVRLYSCLFLVMTINVLSSTAQDTRINHLIQQRRFPFQLTKQGFAGPGWDTLKQQIKQTHFLLIGEEPHGVAQIPPFVEALSQVLQPKAFVAEISPYEAQDLNQLAQKTNLPLDYQRRYPFALSFYSWTQEFELAQSLRSRHIPIIGIDQVYIGSVGRLLTMAAEQIPDKQLKTDLHQLATTFLTKDRRVYEPQSQTNFWLDTIARADLERLRRRVDQQKPAVGQMIDEVLLTQAISNTYRDRSMHINGLSGHQTRINRMKYRLLSQLYSDTLTAGQPLPKMLFKFGTNHMGRDRSLTSNLFDVGNLMVNLADAQNQRSLHVLVVGKQGSYNAKDSFEPQQNSSPLRPEDNAYLNVFFEPTPDSWQLIDLRPLRLALTNHQLDVSSLLLERAILNYDYVVVIAEVSASNNY